ncbi:LicD family protein [bacterium]|nr:LicD family protein [bacterium]
MNAPVNETTPTLPRDEVMAHMLQEVLRAMNRVGVTYTVGGESLLGIAEGNFTKYKNDIYLYLFQLSLTKKFKLFRMLLSKGIVIKPKRITGRTQYKVRIRPSGKKKHPYSIMILPVHRGRDAATIYSGGQANHYENEDFNPDHLQQLYVENTPFLVPQALESFIKKYRKQLLSESYKQHAFRFTPKTRRQAHRVLRTSCEILEDLGIHYWLDFGTLLGLIRENKLIDWDKDMDLSIRYESDEKMERMIKALGKHHPIRVLAPNIRPDIWKLGRYRTIKAFHKKFGFIKANPHLDFFTQYRGQYGNDSNYTYRSIIAGTNNEIPAAFVDELDTFEFEGHAYSIPNHAEDFLAIRYGADWRTPKKDWFPPFDDKSMIRTE